MKILVTGATGFIGNHLITELLNDKSVEIIATSRDIKKAKLFEWFYKVTYIEYDIDNDFNGNLFKYFNEPDKVIHLAWDGLSNYNDLIHIEHNLFKQYKFIKNIVTNGLRDIIVTGTCLEYGMINGCLSETLETNPTNTYAIAKDSLRKFIVELNKSIDFNYKWIRLFYMFGEGQSKKSLIALLDESIRKENDEFKMSGGEQLRDFLYIKDVVQNIILISNQNYYTNESINCCSGNPISVRKLVEDYLLKYNYSIELKLGFYPYPTYEPMAFWGDNTKLLILKKRKGRLND